MPGLLRRASAVAAPAACGGVAFYFHCALWVTAVARQKAQEAHARLVDALTSSTNVASSAQDVNRAQLSTYATTQTRLHTDHKTENRAALEEKCKSLSGLPRATAESVVTAGRSVSSPRLVGTQNLNAPRSGPAKTTATTTTTTVKTTNMAATQCHTPSAQQGMRSCWAASSASPPAAPSGPASAVPQADPSASHATPPSGMDTKGTPEPKDIFVAIPGTSRTGPATLCFQTFGAPADPTILLLAGLGHSCLYWRDAFCEGLAQAGYYVLRVDNRDAGLSSRADNWLPPPLWQAVLPAWLAPAAQEPPPYLLAHLAQDMLQLLDALGLPCAHVVGSSMGGMVAQEMALQAPERVTSLTLFFTSAGGRSVKRPPLRAQLGVLSRPKGDSEEALIDFKVRLDARNAGTLPFDEAASRAYWRRALRRSPNDTAAFQRQCWALLKSPGRAERLEETSRRASFPPTTIVHGTADMTIPHENGEHLAASIHGSKIILWPGMGHSIPPALDTAFIDQIKTQLEPQ